jgi:hypothetical protein
VTRNGAVVLLAALGGVVAIEVDRRGEPGAPDPEPIRARPEVRRQRPEVPVVVSGERAPWDGLDLPPPPPPGSQPVERPPTEPMPQDIFVARLEAALDLLDETAARVEQDLADGEAAGDDERALRARVRLQRLASARERRAAELERARRGELLPP